MNNLQKSKTATIALAASLALLLSSCTMTGDLQMTNTCGQPTTVGVDLSGSTNWFELTDGGQLETDVGGTSEIKLSVNPTDERAAPFVTIDLDDLEWKAVVNSADFANLDFDEFELCP